jgi:acyl-CoA reductase-like NAD-dependent aldehyde dehydrogenase
VCEDAQLDIAADAISFQAFRQGGQVCNRVNRTYVHESVYDEVVDMLTQRISRIKVGLVDDPGADYAALINQKQLEQTQRHVDDALARGAKLQTGGSRLNDPPFDRGWFFAPTLVTDCPADALVMRDETFGPVLGVGPYRDFDAVMEQANDTPYGLSSYLFTRDAGRAHRAMYELEAGTIWINDIHLSYPQCPYGGVKASGVGRTQGIEVMREFLEPVTVYWDFADYRRGTRTTGH